ncbi:LVIVD repeat-containing protein [Nocardia otitidiscaviarum]|uniref:hypothetical protein n=1 Tax=Nocardia otitidiscaviarum TaxID=1823 RepID=UPI0018962A17|nr:hypothetical protein [Nocardia otitidiscaviarum]MBF6183457.1 hypothetical protein [Nocardia otitidiscaviarum]
MTSRMRWAAGLAVVAVAGGVLVTRIVDDEGAGVARADPDIPLVCEDRRPAAIDPGSYGLQHDGSFLHPSLTYVNEEEQHPFPGGGEDLFPETGGYDPNTYRSDNVTVEAHYPGARFTPDPFHSWQNIVDFDGRRYMFQYDRSEARVYDITDVTDVRVVESLSRDDVAGVDGNAEAIAGKDWAAGDFWGASTIQWSDRYDGYIMVQSFEMRRQVPFWMGDTPEHSKYAAPAGVAAARADTQLKGFKVYKLNGPRKRDWQLLATVSTDEHQRDPLAPDLGAPQQGSGSLDVPQWDGGRYMFIATAPSDDWSLQEYPTYLYANGFQAWDMADPARPRLLDTWHREGTVRGEEDAYRTNPRCGNRTSWMGSRNPLYIPTPVEEGGRYGFAALGGLGMSILDISDPANLREIGHLDVPMSVAGTEADNIDVSQFERTGMVYLSGYPLSEDCYEPYKDIFQVDARDPAHPRIVGRLPRPTPPKEAVVSDFCQRGGSFGPKRSGYYTSPGDPKDGLLVYDFYNAGAQFFDVSDPRRPRIAGYFAPPTFGPETEDWARSNPTHGVYVEYDRKIVWLLTNDGIYALSSQDLLGTPNLGAPTAPYRTSAR